MSFIKSMQNRYTTKKYDASKKIESDKLEDLKQILQLSSGQRYGCDIQPNQ